MLSNTKHVDWHVVVCSTYLDRLAEEVNDKLQEAGLISIAELCKNYDLPGDFLSEVSHTAASLYLHVFMKLGNKLCHVCI